MFRAPAKPIYEQSGFINRRLGLGLILVVGLAGAASAAYFMNAQSRPPVPAPTAGLHSAPADASSTAHAPIATAPSAASVIGTQTQQGKQFIQDTQQRVQYDHRDAQSNPVAGVGMHVSGARKGVSATSVPRDASPAGEDLPMAAAGGDDASRSEIELDVSAATVPSVEPAADPVLHITNQGDRIILSYDQNATDPAVALPSDPHPRQTVNQTENPDSAPASDDDAGEEGDPGAVQQPDYTEVYPGCPRALPLGSDKLMAQQMRANYGCVYLSSCTSRNDEVTVGTCTWYLTGKVSG